MRISDWSSDVCSSDLVVLAIIPPHDFVAFGGVQATIEAEAREHAEELVAAAAAAVVQEAGVTPQIMVKSGKQIGRASCRERVCQYVEIPVVAGTLEKKKKSNASSKHYISLNIK